MAFIDRTDPRRYLPRIPTAPVEEGEDDFGRVPEAVAFNPVDIGQSLADSIADNIRVLPDIDDLISGASDIRIDDAVGRANRLAPGFDKARDTGMQNAMALLRGELPFSDVMDIVSDRAELSASLGLSGADQNATLKDLGLSRLSAQQQGMSMFESIMSSLNRDVDPLSDRATPQDFMLNPRDRLDMDVTQEQLVQQSGQSAANLAASPDPTDLAKLLSQTAV